MVWLEEIMASIIKNISNEFQFHYGLIRSSSCLQLRY